MPVIWIAQPLERGNSIPCLPCVPLSCHAVCAPFVMNPLLTPFCYPPFCKNSYDGRNQLTESAAVSTSIGRRDI